MFTDLHFTLTLGKRTKDLSYLSHKNCFISHVWVEFNTQPPTLMAAKTTSFKYSFGGGQFEPDLPGQFAPDSGGQLRPDRGGHIERIFHIMFIIAGHRPDDGAYGWCGLLADFLLVYLRRRKLLFLFIII
ncbi:MAG: hypothetical protein WCQ41_10500 [Bacillota bacterium]